MPAVAREPRVVHSPACAPTAEGTRHTPAVRSIRRRLETGAPLPGRVLITHGNQPLVEGLARRQDIDRARVDEVQTDPWCQPARQDSVGGRWAPLDPGDVGEGKVPRAGAQEPLERIGDKAQPRDLQMQQAAAGKPSDVDADKAPAVHALLVAEEGAVAQTDPHAVPVRTVVVASPVPVPEVHEAAPSRGSPHALRTHW